MKKKYILEIRNRLLLCFIAWICCLTINLYYQNNYIYILIKPCLGNYKTTTFYFIYNNLSEPFYTNLQNILYISNQVVFFVFFFNVLLFIKPGLYKYEYKNLKTIITSGFCFFCFFCFVSYKIILPWSWDFFLNYQTTQKINFFFEAKFIEYMKLIYTLYKLTIILTIINIIFICFLIVLKQNIYYFLRKYRKIIYLLITIISSIITPPDVISQVLLSLSIIMIFEFIIYTFIQIRLYRLRQPIKTYKNT